MSVGRRADGCAFITEKITVFDYRIAIHEIDDGIAVVAGEIYKLTINESHVRLNHFNAAAVAEVEFFQLAVRGVLKSHAELLVLCHITVNAHSCSVTANHAPIDGDEHSNSINSRHLVVDF